MRICSFMPSATEIVCALGMADSLWGVSHECDYPSEVQCKRRMVRSRFDPADYTSQQIDSLVADLTAKGERIYSVDMVALREARPDLIITQELYGLELWPRLSTPNSSQPRFPLGRPVA